LEACGARLTAIGALLVLGSSGSTFAASKGIPLEALARLPENSLWEPLSCPLCAAGLLLEEPGQALENKEHL